MRDLRNLPDPYPHLPIYARFETQDGSLIAYEHPDETYLVCNESGNLLMDDHASYEDMEGLFCEASTDF